MKGIRCIVLVAAAALLAAPVMAQAPQGSAPAAPPSAQKTLASTVGVYVFPTAGQAADQQNKDEGECYNWAVQQSGVDPFNAQKQAQEQQQAQADAAKKQAEQAGKGAGVKGAAKGAAGGAVIGEIASDDAGKGAAYGAAAGAIAGRRQAKKAQAQAAQQADQQAQNIQKATDQQIGQFRKAFSACLEGKKYTVKY